MYQPTSIFIYLSKEYLIKGLKTGHCKRDRIAEQSAIESIEPGNARYLASIGFLLKLSQVCEEV